jgi:HEAT repeat protein
LKLELLTLVNDDDKDVVRCAIAAIGWLGLTTDDIVDTLLDKLIVDDYPSVRKQIVTTLEWLGLNNQRATAALINCLSDESEEVRGEAAFALGELGPTYPERATHGQSITNVLLKLLGSCSGYVCKRVVSTLGRMGVFQEHVVQGLIDRVRNKEIDVEIRSRAASAIGELGTVDSRVSAYKTTIPVLLENLHDDSADIRGKSVTALASLAFASNELGDNKTVVKGVIRLLNDDVVEVRRRAVSALSWLESVRGYDFKQQFLEWLRDEEYQNDVVAAFGYLRYDDKEISNYLLDLINKCNDTKLRENIASAFGRIGNVDDDIVGMLYSLADDSLQAENVRIASIAALGQLGRIDNSKVIKRLEELLNEKNTSVSWHAAFALMKLGWIRDQQGIETGAASDKYNSVVKAILLSLNERDEVTRLFGISALGQLNAISPEVLRTLVKLLGATQARVRSASATSIFKLFSGAGTKLTEIVHLLHEGNEEIVQYATMALFITIRATKETINNILEESDAMILERLLGVDKKVWHPILNTEIKVKDIAWLLLHEYRNTSFVRVTTT